MADPHVDLESDVPNVGIGRALIVILVLHVVAILAIYLHSTFFGTESETAASGSGKGAAAAAIVSGGSNTPAAAALVVPGAETDFASGRYIVVTGDTYDRVAYTCNVDPTHLRALNDNRPLRAGVVLDLPAELSSRPVDVHEAPAPRKAQAIAVAEEAPEPSYVRAVVVDETPAPRAVVVQATSVTPTEATPLSDSGQRYTVKSGDTVWRIASRYKVSRENLLKINGISDPRKLYAGREIKIPAQ